MLRVLGDQDLSRRITSDAMAYMGDTYNWERIARRTLDVYRQAERGYQHRPRTLNLCPPLPDEALG